VLGLLVQGLSGIMSGLSHSYTELAFFRVVSGVGGSVFIAVGPPQWSSDSAKKTSRSRSASPAAPPSA
jgi:predicted MFS family arabinose efflux permease